MADFSSSDLGSIYGSSQVANKNLNIQKKGSNLDLDMTDFIQLMITQLTNQGIDETVDTSDMLNQMIQMQMVETIATLTDASVMSYAASLVGKDVTVGKFDSEGNLQEIYGTVTGTGTMNGNQVIFVNDEYYQMSEILAVGKLPPKKEEGDDKVEDTERPKSPMGRRSRTGPRSPMKQRSRTRSRTPARPSRRMKPSSPTGATRSTAARTAHPPIGGCNAR